MAEINFYQGQTDLLKEIKEKDSENIQEIQIKEVQNRLVEFFNIKNHYYPTKK